MLRYPVFKFEPFWIRDYNGFRRISPETFRDYIEIRVEFSPWAPWSINIQTGGAPFAIAKISYHGEVEGGGERVVHVELGTEYEEPLKLLRFAIKHPDFKVCVHKQCRDLVNDLIYLEEHIIPEMDMEGYEIEEVGTNDA